MYCKKCNTLIEKDTSICPNCNFNNDQNLDETTEIFLDRVTKEANQVVVKEKKYRTVLVLLMFLVIGISLFYIIKDSKAINDVNNITTTQQIIILNKKFKFKNIIVNYSDLNFGTSSNTIFYKNNNEYNINISIIDENEYNEILNTNELLDSKLGSFDTKTYASDNSYSHIFNYLDEYYLITINYPSDIKDEYAMIQSEMSKIINTLEKK